MPKRDHQMVGGALAQYAAAGSEAAFRRVVDAWIPLVMGTALRRTGGRRAMAEDITQMVFRCPRTCACRWRPALVQGPPKARNGQSG